MPKAYDDDLRRKVIEAIELNGMKRCKVSGFKGVKVFITFARLNRFRNFWN
jgi:transposase